VSRIPVRRVAVVGCGAIAYEHLGHLARLAGVGLVGVCDTSPAAARFAAERFGAAAWFTDLTTMLDATQPDAVHVLTPPHTHEVLSLQCLAAGADVVCEKPAAPDSAALERMLAAAETCGRHIVESQNLRYNDPVLAVAEAIAAGRLGEVREIDLLLSLDLAGGRFGDPNLVGPGVHLPGGAVHDFLPHLSYLFLLFAGLDDQSPLPADLEVTGRLGNLGGNPRVGSDHLDAMVFSGGLRGRLRLAPDLSPDAFRIVVRGTRGSVETDLYHPYLRHEGGPNVGKRVAVEHLVSGTKLALTGVTNLRDKVQRHDTYHGLGRMIDEIHTAFAAGRGAPITPSMMRTSAALVDRLVALGSRS
jgi:predicted dehydrogenase